jgi:hypothetical protein
LLLPVFLLSPILIHATNYFCYWSFGLLAYTLVFSARFLLDLTSVILTTAIM